MEVIYKIVLIIFLAVGWLAIPFGLPGTLLMLLGTALYAWFMDFSTSSDVRLLIIVSVMAVFTEVTDNVVVLLAARKAQVPTRTTILAIIGGIVGAFVGVPIPVIGSVLGLFLGVFLTTLVVTWIETRNLAQAFTLAKAVLISRTIATAIKMILGAIIAVYVILHL